MAATVKTESGTTQPPGSPPAIWAAFLRAAAWKSWVIVLLFGVITLQGFALVQLASRPPEFVFVDPEGRTTFIDRRVAHDALLKFLADHTQPPDLTVLRFTKDFLRRALEHNSVTVEEQWNEALAMMAPTLRKRVAEHGEKAGIIALTKSAQIRTDLAIDDIQYVAESGPYRHFRAIVTRRRGPLSGGGAGATDRLTVDVVEHIVPPSADRPDGLEVSEWEMRPLTASAGDGSVAAAAAPQSAK